jgi:hypothetical protein
VPIVSTAHSITRRESACREGRGRREKDEGGESSMVERRGMNWKGDFF